MKAVFDTKPESAYDDEIARRYHFPSRYLALIQKCVDDWVIFRRPRASGEGIAYIAVGRVTDVVPDKVTPGHYYAVIRDFLPFDRPVAWKSNGRYAEAALRAIDNVPQVGLYLRGKSARALEEADFTAIVDAGFEDTFNSADLLPRGFDTPRPETQTNDALRPSESALGRRTIEMLVNRKIRDANFRLAVCRAYDNRCAATGMKIVDRSGRSEAQAAHILPVALGGPDVVQNGIALSATVHWLFDRHLISVGEDYRLLVSQCSLPPELKALFIPQLERIVLPGDTRLWPSQIYLALHRERFKAL